MRSSILALFSVVVMAVSMEAVEGSRAAQLDVRRTSRGLKQFEVTSSLTPTDTFAVFEDPATGRTYVQVVDSPLFAAADGPSVLSKIVKSVFKALQGGVKGGGKIIEKAVEKAREEDDDEDDDDEPGMDPGMDPDMNPDENPNENPDENSGTNGDGQQGESETNGETAQ